MRPPTSKENFYVDNYAQTFEGMNSDRLRKVTKLFKSFYGNRKIDRFLDIGCGDGVFASTLKKQLNINEIHGVDISERAVNLARQLGVNALKLDLDENDFPYKSNYFDGIFCGEVIEHLYDPDHLLAEIHRILNPEGLVIITTPNLASWHNRIALLFGYQPFFTHVSLKYNLGKFYSKEKKGSGHIRIFTLRALKEIVQLNNFKIIKVVGATDPTIPTPINIIDKLFSRFPSFSTYIILVLQK